MIVVAAALATLAALVPRGGRRATTALVIAVVITGPGRPGRVRGRGHPAHRQPPGRRTGQRRWPGRRGRRPRSRRGRPVRARRETVDPALATLLQSAGTRWSAATVSAMGGAAPALSSDTAVMSIGGFMGSDPAPTLDQFQAYVTAGEVRYFVEGVTPFGRLDGGGGPGSRGGTASEITSWVQQTFTSATVGGRTVYDLSRPQAQ